MRGTVLLGVLGLIAVSVETRAVAGEVMTDRCSAEVAIVRKYDAKPSAAGTVILKRGAGDKTGWTKPISVKLGDDGHVRWWCHSTTGNWLDVGTWRVKEGEAKVECQDDGEGGQSCKPGVSVDIGSSAWEGWTAEQSRCDDRSTKIRAKLGPDRLLQIECLGK